MENSPRNRQTLGQFDGGPKLASSGESPAIEKNVQRPVLAQKIFGGGKHHRTAEIILLARVVGVRRAKNRVPDDILIQHRAGRIRRQCMAQRSFARARQA
jgi:hypothetical protein